ncbi:MAG: hypothetical protein HY925_07695, partial [Elusimicrobia bacterium]|nr:hypothetical protein [Elusimicrobiota bacterium]
MNLWLSLYQALFPIVGVAVVVQFLAGGRGRSLREGKNDVGQRLGYASPENLEKAGTGALWIHAASVGELSGVAAILKELGLEGRALLTTSTVAGREGAEKLSGAAAAVLAPVDLKWSVERFLDAYKPRALIILETELWPMTLACCVSRGIPVAVANGRMTARSFPRYRWLEPLLGPYLRKLAAVGAQSPADAERYAALGVPPERIRVTGNMKYDAAPPSPEAVAGARAALESLGWRPGTAFIWCA